MTSRTLVLNVTEQPLAVVSAERAIRLILKDKVDVVASNGTVMRSAEEEFSVPSVVRIRHFVHVPYNPAAPIVSRKAVFARDNGLCQYCGRKAENLDHVMPRSKGGAHSWLNLVAACKRCNSRKSDRTLKEAGMKLLRAPKEPKGSRYYVFGQPEPDWLPYLG